MQGMVLLSKICLLDSKKFSLMSKCLGTNAIILSGFTAVLKKLSFF